VQFKLQQFVQFKFHPCQEIDRPMLHTTELTCGNAAANRRRDPELGRELASSRQRKPRFVYAAKIGAALLAVSLPQGGSGAEQPTHTGTYRGSIPAARLAGAIKLANQQAHEGTEGSRRRVSDEQDPAKVIRGGALVHASLGLSMTYTLFEGTPGEAWAKARDKVVVPAVLAVCMLAQRALFSIISHALWLCLGIDLYAIELRKPTIAGLATTLRSVTRPSHAPTGALGPLQEFLLRTKSAGAALADLDLDFLVACRHSLMQFAILAFGHLPVSKDVELPECSKPDMELSECESDECVADTPAASQATPPIRHVFLKQAASAAVAAPADSPMNVQSHELHSCEIAGSSTGVRVCSCLFIRARGKRRGFRPGAAARHSQYARVSTEFVQHNTFFEFSPGCSQQKSRLEPAEVETPKNQKKKWDKIWTRNKIGLQPAGLNFLD